MGVNPRGIAWALAMAALGAGAWSVLGPRHAEREDALARLPRPSPSAPEFGVPAAGDLFVRRAAGSSDAVEIGDSVPGPRSRSERAVNAYDAVFELVVGQSNVVLSERAQEELLGEGPDERRVAYLRAVERWDARHADAVLALAVRALPPRSDPHATSLPEFALGRLGERANDLPEARAELRELAFGAQGLSSASLRRQAVIHLGRASSAVELQALAAEVRAEQDPLVRAAFAAGLLSNSEERLVRVLFTDLLAERAALAGDGDLIHDLETP